MGTSGQVGCQRVMLTAMDSTSDISARPTCVPDFDLNGAVFVMSEPSNADVQVLQRAMASNPFHSFFAIWGEEPLIAVTRLHPDRVCESSTRELLDGRGGRGMPRLAVQYS